MTAKIISVHQAGSGTWVEWAECAKPGAPDMFPFDQDHRGRQAARQTCLVCPVRAECLTEAIERSERDGVWGGLTTEERDSMRRTLVRRASRKNAAIPSVGTIVAVALAASEAMDGAA